MAGSSSGGDSPFEHGKDWTNVCESKGVFGVADELIGKGTSVLDMNPSDSVIGALCKVTNQKDEINAFDVNKTLDGICKTKRNRQGVGIG